ncbi:MAG TPA: c-type cytochrome [Acidobacteriaceae bacterium]|nr:c-type cytochrome [Acidobacteriaceae bacterium]
MTTTVRTRLSVTAGAFASLLFLAAGCNSSKPVMVAASTSPSTTVAVGPIPGGEAVPAGTKNPYDGNAVAIQDGRRLFNWYNCSGCHGGHGGGGMGPSLRNETWLYGNQDDQIYDSIAAGRSKGMPSWGTKIPQNQIWELVAYIKSMRTPQEADPPLEPSAETVQPPTPDMPSGVPLTK